MKKLYIINILLVIFLLITGLAFAQEKGVNSQNRLPMKNIGKNMQDKTQKAKSNLGETREEIKIRSKETTQTLRESLSQKREELKIKVEQKREELKTKVETKREELKQRLEKVKDEKKKQAVERIDKQIDALNEKMMKHYTNVLDKLSDVLVRISERAGKTEERGVDVSAVRTAIDAANGVITMARLAIEMQSGKTYTIQISTESALKVDVGKTRQALHNDLASVRSAVKAAYDAVKNAATTLAKLPRPTSTPATTESPAPTPSAESR